MLSLLPCNPPVAKSKQSAPKILRVTCLTCHERMEVDLQAEAYTANCTFCGGRVAIPSRDEALKRIEAQKPLPAPVVEGYAVAASEPTAQTKPVKRDATGKQAAQKVEPHLITVECPTCNERMRAPVGDAPGRIACVFCQSVVRVPARHEITQWKEKKVEPKRKEEIGEYAAGPVIAPAPLRMNLFDRMAEIRTEAPIAPPRWAFFSSVFTFPWREGTVTRWGGMTIGYLSVGLISTILLGGGGEGGAIGVMGLGFFALPLLWITIFTLGYSSDCCLCVLESTAYGHDKIDQWPEGGWREWFPKLLYLMWVGALPTVVCSGIGRLAQMGGLPYWPVMLGALFVLYPIVLLSALEANSVWVPLTLPIIKSLFVLWWAWLLVYVLSGAILTGLGALLLYGLPRREYETIIAFAPLLAASLLIYARLLGRLAWKIGERL